MTMKLLLNAMRIHGWARRDGGEALVLVAAETREGVGRRRRTTGYRHPPLLFSFPPVAPSNHPRVDPLLPSFVCLSVRLSHVGSLCFGFSNRRRACLGHLRTGTQDAALRFGNVV